MESVYVENVSLSTTYFACWVVNVFYNTSLVCINKKSGTWCEQRMGLTKSKKVHLFWQICEHACFVTLSLSATETGCLCEHDSLSFMSQRLIVFNCVCESVLVYVQRPVSDQASFTQTLNFGGVLFPDPIRCCQSHKLNTLFILSPSLPCLS